MTTNLELTPRIPAEESAINLLDQAKATVIITTEDRMDVEAKIQNAKTLEDEIFGYLDPPRAKAYDDYKYHKQRLDDAIKPVQSARQILKQKCITWDQEQERLRRAVQARLEAEARKCAEDEALADAMKAEGEGDTETAEAIINEPVQVPPVFVARTYPAASRLSAGRSVWSAETTNFMALIRAVAEGKQPITLILPNQVALNKMATALKSSLAIPGVKAVERKV